MWLAFHSSKQELLDKKESASAPEKLTISEKPLPLEQKSIAAAPSATATDDTNEKEENARAQGLLSSKNDQQPILMFFSERPTTKPVFDQSLS